MTISDNDPADGFSSMNTVLYCRRFQETVTFYEQILGLARGYCNEWFVEFQVAPGAFLSVADQRRASVKTASGGGITLTLRVADARALHTLLRTRGVQPPPVGARPWGAEGFLVHDPEGTRLEIWSSMRAP